VQEITWIADHKINIENLHNLSFEKTQNMIMKQILGVHGKTPNLAIHAELGLLVLWVCNTCQFQ
jgi:hypothetical protein